MNTRPDKPDVFTYQSSRVYLADLFAWYRKKKVSLRSLAKKLNVSPALLSLIAQGKRLLTEENVALWAPVLAWSEQEVSWLKQLVVLEFAAPEDKRQALKNLTRFKAFHQQSSNEVLTYKYLKHWWHVAIRELSELRDFREDEAWIQERLLFSVSLADVRKALRFLNKHQLLAKHGGFRRLDCRGDIYKLSLSDFHQQILEKAVASIYAVPSEGRHILGHTMALPKEKLPELKRILDESLEKIAQLSSTAQEETEIFHVGLVGFPLTQHKEKK